MRISWPGVFISTVVVVTLRYLWYAHFAGADWDHLATKAVDAMVANRGLVPQEALVALLVSAALGWLIGQLREQSILAGIAAGIIVCAGFALTTFYAIRLHAPVRGDLLIDAGYMFAAYAVSGAILGATTPRR